jgi:hypothetical protein
MNKTQVLRLRFKVANKDNLIERKIAELDPPHLHSHVELQFPDESSFSSRAFASNDGQKKRNGTSFANIDYAHGNWNTVEIPVTDDELVVVHAWCVGEDGEEYDFKGATKLKFDLWLLGQDPNKWFCSEVAATACQQIGWFRDLVSHKTSPDLLYAAALEVFDPPLFRKLLR